MSSPALAPDGVAAEERPHQLLERAQEDRDRIEQHRADGSDRGRSEDDREQRVLDQPPPSLGQKRPAPGRTTSSSVPTGHSQPHHTRPSARASRTATSAGAQNATHCRDARTAAKPTSGSDPGEDVPAQPPGRRECRHGHHAEGDEGQELDRSPDDDPGGPYACFR